MNSVLLFDSDKMENDLFELKDARAEHIFHHLKLKAHDTLNTTLIGLGVGQSQIVKCEKTCVVIKPLQHQALPSSALKLSVGLSRPPTMKKILEHATTFGVTEFELFQAALSEKSYASSKVLSPKSVHELICLGLSQSRTYSELPSVQITKSWTLSPSVPSYYLDAQASLNLLTSDFKAQRPCHFLLGPERGWTDQERQQLQAAGATAISLGPSTLRVEHAVFALLGQWHLLQKA